MSSGGLLSNPARLNAGVILPETACQSALVQRGEAGMTSRPVISLTSVKECSRSYNMTAERLVEILLHRNLPIRPLNEATVRLPPRGSRWIAVFTGPEPGQQIWKSTGLTNRDEALAMARRWEAQARRERAARGRSHRKPTIRVRPGSAEAGVNLLTQEQVAAILDLSERAVREIERRAFRKLRRHPALRKFWREYSSGAFEEACIESSSDFDLTNAEIVALFARTRSSVERLALRKILAFIQVLPHS